MSYDLFISYCRQDNKEGRITELVKRIKTDFVNFTGKPERPLIPFFDLFEIQGMDDWRGRILKGLRESRLMLACLSPGYLKSEYCEWEFNEYIKHEIGRSYSCEGIAPIYFIDVPGWEEKGFDKYCKSWVSELRHRHYIDFRPWYKEGEAFIHESFIEERFIELNRQINVRIEKGERLEKIPGNIDAHNHHFIGRRSELDRLRRTVAEGKVGLITAVYGLGGIGKTALAIEYAYVFASEYGGGRWQIRCEGKENLAEAIVELAPSLRIDFNEYERSDLFLQLQRVLSELQKITLSQSPSRCLLLLDNIDNPNILSPNQVQHLPSGEWLHVIVTTRLGEDELQSVHKDRTFLSIDELPQEDALLLIESYQPGGIFRSDSDREAAKEMVNLLGGYTLSIEALAVYLGYYADEVSCQNFLSRMRKEGLLVKDPFPGVNSAGIRHGEKSLVATLIPTLERLSPPEKLILIYAAFLPADFIPLNWIRPLIADEYPEYIVDPEPGYPDIWKQILRRLFSMRLLHLSHIEESHDDIIIAKMHRIVGPVILNALFDGPFFKFKRLMDLEKILYLKATELDKEESSFHEALDLNILFEIAKLELQEDRFMSTKIAASCANGLRFAGYFAKSLELSEILIKKVEKSTIKTDISKVLCYNIAGVAALYLKKTDMAEEYFLNAEKLLDSSEHCITLEDRLSTMTNLSCLYREIYRPDKALNPGRKALSLAKDIYGKDSAEVALRSANLGLIYLALAQIDKSEVLLRNALFIDRRNPHLILRTCQDLSSLAEVLRSKCNNEEAEKITLEAISLAEKHGFEKHPVFPFILMNYSGILEDKEDYCRSKELLTRSMAGITSCYGKNSLQVSHCLNNLGVNSIGLKDYKSAISLLENAIQIEEAATNINKINLAHRKLNLSVALLLDNQINKSESMINSALAYFISTEQNNLLCGRLLLIAIIIAQISVKTYDSYLIRLNKIFDCDNILSIGINYRWSLENILRQYVKQYLPEFKEDFENLHNRLTFHSIH